MKTPNKLSKNTYSARRDLLRKRLAAHKVDAYLTFDFSDAFYLTGFPSEGCFVLASKAGDFMFSPLLLAEHARAATAGDSLEVVWQAPLLQSLEKTLKKQRLKKVGFDPSKLTVGLYRDLQKSKGVKWVGLDGFVLSQRMIKDEPELQAISRACHITYQSCKATFAALEEGLSEAQVARQLERRFNEGGSPKVAFETIVAFGENAAYPHHVVTDKSLKKNQAVLMDLGCTVDGYRSDLTRTAYFGSITPRFKKVYDIVKKSQAEGIAAVKEGVTAGEIDFICREVIRKEGFGDYFIHGTGHGVGIDIHEPPRLGVNSKEVLKPGMVVTVEPGIYLPGEFGVRIEDTVLVQKNGCEILTK